MNRIDFIGQTQSGNHMSLSEIVEFFDHTITAYNIVKDVEPISMHSSTDMINSSLKIQIEAPDASKLHGVVAYINDTMHNHTNTYGKSFEIDARIYGKNQIELFVRNETM